jgi:hypothetical protein
VAVVAVVALALMVVVVVSPLPESAALVDGVGEEEHRFQTPAP